MLKYVKKRKFLCDERGELLDEMIDGIKSVKFNAWERVIKERLTELRKKEENNYFFKFLFNELSVNVNTLMASILAFVSFGLYYRFYGGMSAGKVFALLTLYYNLVKPIRLVVFAVNNYISAKVASERFIELLNFEENMEEEGKFKVGKGEIVIVNADFSWESKIVSRLLKEKKDDKEKFVLKDINLDIQRGEFVLIIGKVGSGKTSLLHAIINDLKILKGTVKTNGRIALIPQESILFNNTIEKNITFGLKYHSKKFKDIIKKCELAEDLFILPGHKYTQIGEKGLNLSGGQKQRISIARALYSESDIYIIDCALSSLDPEISHKIMENVFYKSLKKKTRIMATHNLDFLKYADKVIIVDKGRISFQGNLEECIQKEEFKEFFDNHQKLKKRKAKILEIETMRFTRSLINESLLSMSFQNNNSINIPSSFDNEQSTINSNRRLQQNGNLTQLNLKNKGMLSKENFYFYISKYGMINITILCIIHSLLIALKNYGDLWISYWMNDTLKFKQKYYYYYTYNTALSLTTALLLYQSVVFSFSSSKSGYKIFNSLLYSLLNKKMKFFETIPSGEIINRTVQDANIVDENIPSLLTLSIPSLSSILSAVIVSVMASPTLLILIVIIILFLKNEILKYVILTTEFERMAKSSFSFLVASVSEMIKGESVIRVFEKKDYMKTIFKKRYWVSTACYYHSISSPAFICIRVDYITILLVIGTCLLLIFGENFK